MPGRRRRWAPAWRGSRSRAGPPARAPRPCRRPWAAFSGPGARGGEPPGGSATAAGCGRPGGGQRRSRPGSGQGWSPACYRRRGGAARARGGPWRGARGGPRDASAGLGGPRPGRRSRAGTGRRARAGRAGAGGGADAHTPAMMGRNPAGAGRRRGAGCGRVRVREPRNRCPIDFLGSDVFRRRARKGWSPDLSTGACPSAAHPRRRGCVTNRG
jgi:hypothetical protein